MVSAFSSVVPILWAGMPFVTCRLKSALSVSSGIRFVATGQSGEGARSAGISANGASNGTAYAPNVYSPARPISITRVLTLLGRAFAVWTKEMTVAARPANRATPPIISHSFRHTACLGFPLETSPRGLALARTHLGSLTGGRLFLTGHHPPPDVGQADCPPVQRTWQPTSRPPLGDGRLGHENRRGRHELIATSTSLPESTREEPAQLPRLFLLSSATAKICGTASALRQLRLVQPVV
ncbi:hypothetical protein J2808_004262 [Pseudarthrobacter sulfonivorans]|nr:hypothetical protein [Pseudarthrobacter sulfonivorans]